MAPPSDTPSESPKTLHSVAIFLAASLILMYQILMARVFVVMTGQHIAFVVISMALLGLTLSAVHVQLRRVKPDGRMLSLYFLGYAICALLSLCIVSPRLTGGGLLALFIFLSMAVFFFLGAIVASILSSFPRQSNRLYALDLLAAGVGALLCVLLLPHVGLSNLILSMTAVALLTAVWLKAARPKDDLFKWPSRNRTLLASMAFALAITSIIKITYDFHTPWVQSIPLFFLLSVVFYGAASRSVRHWRLAIGLLLAALFFSPIPDRLVLSHCQGISGQSGTICQSYVDFLKKREIFDIFHITDKYPGEWNVYSYVEARDGGRHEWGIWALWPTEWEDKVTDMKTKGMYIGSGAATTMYRFDGKALSPFDYLQTDIVNSAYGIRPIDSVVVIGVGGGRDILSALNAGATDITGLEYNQIIYRWLTDTHADFSGHLAKHPFVRLVNDEARSWLTRSDKRADLIVMSLVDTYESSTNGSLATAETALYTAEAWRLFHRHLTDDGVLSVARWGGRQEIGRLASLAQHVLAKEKYDDPERHVIILGTHEKLGSGKSVAVLLLSKSPFSEDDMGRLLKHVEENGFHILLAPGLPNEVFLGKIINDQKGDFSRRQRFHSQLTTDNSPFFFERADWQDRESYAGAFGNFFTGRWNQIPVLLLALLISVLASVLLVILPLLLSLWRSNRQFGRLSFHFPETLFFTCIGLGYLTMEIAMLHKFGLFLGHPGYALPVVITGMLLASGGGSLISHSVCDRFGIGAVAGLVIGLLLLGTLTMDAVLTFFVAEVNAVRLLIGAVYLFIIGFPLGMMFPIGMRLASARSGGNMLAWFWGINGVMSVVATIAEVIIVQAWGISVVFVLVIFLYVIACASLIWQSRRARSGSY